jgi:hypothetical protein
MRRGFLIMPFSARFDWLRQEIVLAGQDSGFEVERGDDIFKPGVVLEQIEASILNADAVIAVCTGKSANVFYEMGIARTFHEVILVAESDEDLPFDVGHFRAHLYGGNPGGVRGAVAEALRTIALKPMKPLLRHLAAEVASEQVVAPIDGEELYWLDHAQILRRLPNEETATVFAANRPVIRLPSMQLDRLVSGPPISPLSKQHFRRINLDVFVLIEGLWFYLNTLAPIYRHGWASVPDLPEITEHERRTYRPFP